MISPTLRVASHTGMPLEPVSNRLQPAYPESVANTFRSTVMVVVADLVDGQLRAVGGGSGVIVGGDGSVLTNYHVLHRKDARLRDVFIIGRFISLDQPPRLVCAATPRRRSCSRDRMALIRDMDLDGRPVAECPVRRPYLADRSGPARTSCRRARGCGSGLS
jgi:hypothetical protein